MSAHPHRRSVCKLVSWLLALCFFQMAGHTAPPEYQTFRREQRPDYTPVDTEVLRIWMVYVGQGDGIIIQLPTKYSYASESDDDASHQERIDVVVDGGGGNSSDARRLTDFIGKLYGANDPSIEHIVITHHDDDHVGGITHLLGESHIGFDHVLHNGLASYRVGKRGFTTSPKPANALMHGNGKRGMAFINSSDELDANYLINNITELRRAQNNSELEGIYDELAEAVLNRKEAGKLNTFERAHVGAPFIKERVSERGVNLADMKFRVLWPPKTAKAYASKDWGKTINGNSVTFRLEYKNFSMLFTGDHNEPSQTNLLAHLKAQNNEHLLDCDVFKVPHHGSSHGVREFYDREQVLAVASMGDKGFKSKSLGGQGAWQHPSTTIIDWLGGPHRVYHTYVHEKRFDYTQMTTEARRQSLIEVSHILIETDGTWFRLVEVPIDTSNPNIPPAVTKTRRGNGTQWIRAK
jgi:beta-lactamase superfamily II metal-dependent hydrolase